MRKSVKGKFEEVWKSALDGAELTPSGDVWDSISSRLSNNQRSNKSFERRWRNAFTGAELEPHDEVWKAIDVGLVQGENASMKKRIFYYQRLAAASAGILILFGAYSYFFNGEVENDLQSENKVDTGSGLQSKLQDHDQNLNSKTKSEQSDLSDEPKTNTNTDSSSIDPAETNPASIKNENTNLNNNSLAGDSKTSNKSASATTTVVDVNRNFVGKVENGKVASVDHNSLYHFTQGPISELNLADVSKLPTFFGPNDYSIAYRLADARPAVVAKKKPETMEKSWASVGFSAGSFSPGGVSGNNLAPRTQTNSPGTAMFDLKSTKQAASTGENIKSGSSISMAISGGKRIFKRWVLQGGVSYLSQTSSSESEVVNVAPANQVYNTASFAPETTNSVTYETLQEINSTFQYLTGPLQLGYMVVDKKFGVQINGGISPDFFLKNSVYNESTQVETSNSSGEGEAFKTVSLSGLGSIEFSYKFFEHYRVSLMPGVRYTLTPVYNDNSFASAKPFVADIGLRFRYIF